jgi:hypothetical protein
VGQGVKHVSAFFDRHGRRRHRFRKTGCKPAYLKGEPGTPEFDAEYQRCLGNEVEPAPYREPSGLVFQLDMLVTCDNFDASGPFIYFVESEHGLVKIGFSVSLRERFKKLQTCSSLPLKLLGLRRGTIEGERQLHKRFAAQRVRGEWFAATDEIRAAARGNCA